MTSAAAIMKGKDLETSNPPQANHPCVHLSLCVCSCTLVYSCSSCLRLCVRVRLHARAHVRGDKRVLDVSRGEGLWNMESSRVVLCVTPVL